MCRYSSTKWGCRKKKTNIFLEVARSLLFSNHIPKNFWGEAILTATYFINKMPSRRLKFQTPRELLIQAFPHTKFISSDLPPKVFVCSTFVHIHQQNHTKLEPKSVKYIFLGYSTNQKLYKCYSLSNRKIYNSMDVTFFEGQPYYPKPEIQGEGMREYQLWDSPQEATTQLHQPENVSPVVVIQSLPNTHLETSSTLAHVPMS